MGLDCLSLASLLCPKVWKLAFRSEAHLGAGGNQKAISAWESQPVPHRVTWWSRYVSGTEGTWEVCCLSPSLWSHVFWLICAWKCSTTRPQAYLMEDDSTWSKQTARLGCTATAAFAFALSPLCLVLSWACRGWQEKHRACKMIIKRRQLGGLRSLFTELQFGARNSPVKTDVSTTLRGSEISSSCHYRPSRDLESLVSNTFKQYLICKVWLNICFNSSFVILWFSTSLGNGENSELRSGLQTASFRHPKPSVRPKKQPKNSPTWD